MYTFEQRWEILRQIDLQKMPILAKKNHLFIWPPRSCDLTPLDYYLWDAAKEWCYADKPEIIDDLKDNIHEAIAEIQLQTIDNMLKYWTSHLGYCMASRGSHLNEIIFRY